MTIATLYISHQQYDWATMPNAGRLLTSKNFKTATTNSGKENYHTSLEDLNFKLHNTSELFDCVETISLVDLDKFFINKVGDGSIYLYLNFFKNLRTIKNVENFEWINSVNYNLFVNPVDVRKTESKNLWITGCSVTHGMGVDVNQRYAHIVSESLGLPTTVLTLPGTSTAWQADQILQADIRAGDMVIWGLTSFNRVNIAEGLYWKTYTITGYFDSAPEQQYWKIDFFNSLTQSIPCIKSILQVINFCNKIGAELYLINLLESTWVDLIFNKYKNYIDLTVPFDTAGKHRWLDLGTDNDHPGPQQHQFYAERILNLIKENHHGN